MAFSIEPFFRNLCQYVEGRTVVLGNFNSVTDNTDRLSGNLDATSVLLDLLLKELDLHEIPGLYQKTFTYQHLSISNCKSHLDRIYVNFGTDKLKVYTSHISFSDHDLVGMFRIPDDDYRPKQWRFNSDTLLDKTFCL